MTTTSRMARALHHTAAVALAAVSFIPNAGRAQSQYDVFGSGSLAIAAYEASKDQCVYSDKLGNALAEIDAFLNRQDAVRWEEAKRLGPNGLTGPRNVARIQGVSDCKVYGLLIGNASIIYFNDSKFDQAVFTEFNLLLKGEGRSKSGEAGARPPQPPAPGSAADTIARMNGGRGIDNTPAAQPHQGSTLKRLPADDPSPTLSRSQPPPRQSAEPSRVREPAQPALSAPSVAPPNLASPNVAPQPVPPPASSSDCSIAGDCRLARPAFACNLDDAARIAGAGLDAGRQVGLATVRAGTCETVAAGRSLRVEATKVPNVVYATEQGRHVGYLPVNVSAPADQASAIACRVPGYCAVRPGAGAWICPQPDGLSQPTPETKRTVGCLQFSSYTTAEVGTAEGDTVALLNMIGGSPPVSTRYYIARGDLIGLDLTPPPTPASRGWCRPGDWCVISVGALFCWDRMAHTRIMSLPSGEARRAAISAEADCRLLVPGSLLKPKGMPAADDPRKLIEVEHPVLKMGWASANAFKVVSPITPTRYTAKMFDFVVSINREPAMVAVALRAQGTSEASANFRSGPSERLAFCTDYWGDVNATKFRECLSEPDATRGAKANCYAKRISLDGQRYELRARPADLPSGSHIDEKQQWLFKDLATGEWLDGTTISGEPTISTAFNALCPGANPDATSKLVYRASNAQFPRELYGRWYDDRRACADPRRNDPDYEDHTWMVISAEGRVGSREFEWPQQVNAVRALDRGAWEVDGSHRIDDPSEPEIFQSITYRLTRDGRLVLRQQGTTSEWVRC